MDGALADAKGAVCLLPNRHRPISGYFIHLAVPRFALNTVLHPGAPKESFQAIR